MFVSYSQRRIIIVTAKARKPFLARREESVRKLCDSLYGSDVILSSPEIRLGAEIRLIKDMPELLEIEQLILEGTNMALFELPYDEYHVWMGENIHNISIKYHLRPIIAHVERYVDLFRENEYEELVIDSERNLPDQRQLYECEKDGGIHGRSDQEGVPGIVRQRLP